jgi:hypothetical protein
LEENFDGDTEWIIGFPDDDCTYAEGTIDAVKSHFTQAIDVLCIPYGPTPALVDRKRFPEESAPIGARSALVSVASAGLFIRVRESRPLRFNEKLGVGALLGSCEDVDVVLQLIKVGATVRYEPSPVVCHPYGAEGQTFRQAGRLALLAARSEDFAGFPIALVRALTGLVIRAVRRPASISAILAAVTLGLHPASIRAVKQQSIWALESTNDL